MRRIGTALAAGLLVLGVGLWLTYPAEPELPALGGSFGWGSLPIDGLERRYELYTPAKLARPPALVFALHGSQMDGVALRQLNRAGFAALADREGFLLVYPEGFELEWNGCRAPGVTEADRRNLDDVGFHEALIERLAGSHDVDRSRVYAVGFSNGGQMVYRLASDAPERFAALAAISANQPGIENTKCEEPSGPVSILIMNGREDPIVPYEGGIASFYGLSSRGRVLSAERTANHWKRANELRKAPDVEFLPDSDTSDLSRPERRIWRGDGGSEVVLFTIHGGGHSIPGGGYRGWPWLVDRVVGRTNRDIQAAEEIWSFFARHPAEPEPEAGLRTPRRARPPRSPR